MGAYMDIPGELVDRICNFLDREDLKNTLTVSRSFQYGSERASGAFAEFDLSEDNAQAFINLYSGRRWGYLRHVRFRTHLFPYKEDQDEWEEKDEKSTETGDYSGYNLCRESSQELQAKDELFTEQINFVFATLRTVESRVCSGRLKLTIYTPVRQVDGCPHRKCTSWRLHLRGPHKLSEVASVRALCVEDEKPIHPLKENQSQLKVDLRILIDLAAKLPSLEYLGCQLSAGSGWTTDNESEAARHYLRDWAGPHRDSRHAFAKAFEIVTLPSTLRQAQLNFLYPLYDAEHIDQTQEVPDLVSPMTYDLFSSSLRLLSQRLRKLELKVVADATLFWPTDGAASWPYLERICVLLHMSSPSGRWYFEGPRGEGRETNGYKVTSASYPPLEDTSDDDSWDVAADDNNGLDLSNITCTKFRVQPNDEVLVPFLTAFAKAASRMLALNEARIWVPLIWDAGEKYDYENHASERTVKRPRIPPAWRVAYVAPTKVSSHTFSGQCNSQSRQLWWSTAQWRPSNELHHLFQRIGDQSTELIEYWGHEE